MAYDRKKLSGNLGSGSDAPKSFTYKDTDSTKVGIAAADYFLDANDVMEVGDVIYTFGSDGGQFLAVATSSSAGVTTAVV